MAEHGTAAVLLPGATFFLWQQRYPDEEEALSAATINAAYAIDRADDVGSMSAGTRADLVIWGLSSVTELPLHFGRNMVDTVIKAGQIVVDQERSTYAKNDCNTCAN